MASNYGNCIARIYRATEAWKQKGQTSGEELTWLWTFKGEDDMNAPQEINVTEIVREWSNGTQPNYGFFFVGPNENLGGKNSNECMTILSDLRLEVLETVKK